MTFSHVVRSVVYNDETDDFTVIVENLIDKKVLAPQTSFVLHPGTILFLSLLNIPELTLFLEELCTLMISGMQKSLRDKKFYW